MPPWEKYASADGPWAKYGGGQSKAKTDAEARRKPNSFTDQTGRSLSLGLQDLTNAGMSALVSQAPRLAGKDPGYGLGEAFNAAREVEGERGEAYNRDKPGRSLLSGVVGGLAMPGGKQAAALALPKLKGLLGGLEAVGRGAGVGGALGGVYGAATAKPGQEAQGATRGAVTGAVTGGAVPVVGATLGAGARGAGSVGRAVARTANKASGGQLLSPTKEAGRRLVEALRKDGVTPEGIRAVQNQWLKTGVSPSLLDAVSVNGGGQNTRSLLRGSAMQGGGRNEATQYARGVNEGLQSKALGLTERLSPGETRTVPQVEREIASRIDNAAQQPNFNYGQGGADVSQGLSQRFAARRGEVNQAYNAARAASPDQAMIPDEPFFELSAGVREAVRDFDPANVPRVARELDSLDKMTTPAVRDLFDLRSRLSRLSASNDPVEATAAGAAVRGLDEQITRIQGSFTGDPGVTQAWRDAIAKRAQMGREFQGDDLVQRLTQQERRGGGYMNTIAPEDASAAIMGRSGVSPKANAPRDLERIRGMLGEDSPEWQSLQREAEGRLMARDTTPENFGRSFSDFERQNPELADILLSQQARQGVTASRGEVTQALGDRRALASGRGVVNTPADTYAGEFQQGDLGRLGAFRDVQDFIARGKEGAVGRLNDMTADSVGRNLSTAFGDEAASTFRGGTRNLVEQAQNARFIDPGTNSQTAGRLMDAGELNIPQLPRGVIGVVSSIIDKIRQGATLTDGERQAIVQLGIADQLPDDLAAMLQAQAQRSQLGSQLAPTAAVTMAGRQ